jgi:hypothetical protein
VHIGLFYRRWLVYHSLPSRFLLAASGKWQAQFYFFGKSRYVGVYDTALQASVAYNAALHLSRKYKQGIRSASLKNKVDPAQEANRLLVAARILGRNAAFKFQEELDKRSRLYSPTGNSNATEAAYQCAEDYIETQASTVYRPPMK